ncbi:TPX2 importin domain-containing protein [Citrus sinensis]|uniref:TPX2 importin domain-containing protein n=1 Tax=Citrus sinensis TaxID=2711 RepID=A0ACB8LVR2_CITSI|nr:TPX2 importin domain-containing protein [Citrus sinensis]
MEEEMEVELPVFEAREIDLEYEFDAARFFDFTREESFAEAREAELWFESAPNYPPSPFVAKLFLREDILLENVNTSPKTKVTSAPENDSDNGMGAECSITNVEDTDCAGMIKGIFSNLQSGNLQKVPNQLLNLTTGEQCAALSNSLIGLEFYDHISHDKVKSNAKSAKKAHSRSSTLMKPTTSHLAKQNRPVQVGNSRFQMQLVQSGDRSLCNSSLVESQAAKRQKLEGGHLRKDGTIDKNSLHARLRLTIPREPDLETANRAQRIRPKVIAEQENISATAHRFKARPLNRKILEAPTLPLPKKSMPRLPEFQEFHLKTLERAMQHTSAISSSSLHCTASDKSLQELDKASAVLGNGNREFERPSGMNTVKQDGCDVMHNFKALPLNKKEFNFQTERKVRPNPPVELFSKMTLPVKEKTSGFVAKQNLCGNDGCINKAGTPLGMRIMLKQLLQSVQSAGLKLRS